MMRVVRVALPWLLALASLAIIAWFSAQTFVTASAWLGTLNLGAGIVPALLTALIALAGVIYGRLSGQRHDIELRLREEKVKVYDQFIETWPRILDELAVAHAARIAANSNEAITPKPEHVVALKELARKFILWGSNGVIKKYGTLERTISQNPVAGVYQYEDVLYQMRKDLGHRQWGMGRNDLLRLFVTDIDKKPSVPPTAASSSTNTPPKANPNGQSV